MRPVPCTRRRPRWPAAPAAALSLALWLAACHAPPEPLPGGSSEPAAAVRALAATVRANDLSAYTRLSVPPAEHAALAKAWDAGLTRWPLSEMPLEAKLVPLLAALSAPTAAVDLRRMHQIQFVGQSRALAEAARSLGVFGTQYVRHEGEYSAEERDRYAQWLSALSAWGQQAPLSDPARARASIDTLIAAARTAGFHDDAGIRAAGMDGALRRLGPFLAALKTCLVRYDLDLDASIDALQVGLVKQSADLAEVRLQYPLALSKVDVTVSMVRIDGHWYVQDTLRHARAAIAAAESVPPLPAPDSAAPSAGAPAGSAPGAVQSRPAAAPVPNPGSGR